MPTPACRPRSAPAPRESVRRVRARDGAILPNGRRLSPTVARTDLGGIPAGLLAHPTLGVLYVANISPAVRAIQVVRQSDGAVIQTVSRAELWHGMALAPDATELYVAGGRSADVQVFAIDPATGLLTLARTLPLAGRYVGGMGVSSAANVLYSCDFQGGRVFEVDRTSGAVLREANTFGGPLEALLVPSRGELWVSDYRGHEIVRVELAGFTVAGRIDVGGDGAMGMLLRPDGTRVYVSVTDDDRELAIDTASLAVAAERRIGGGRGRRRGRLRGLDRGRPRRDRTQSMATRPARPQPIRLALHPR